jgi:hypothetical protein
MAVSPPDLTLTIVGNSPGEVSGWAIPIAAEARRVAEERGRRLEVALCLPPCQFASGQEHGAAAASGLFDHVVDPRAVVRLCLGLRGWSPAGAPVVLHVGGDFWYSRRLARRWHAPAYAFVERAHVARGHRHFERIFVPTPQVRERLLRNGVPDNKLMITGDPLHDAVLMDQRRADLDGNGVHPRVTFLPGSRDAIFSAVFPFWVRTAAALRPHLPDARLQTVISPFVSPRVQEALVKQHQSAIEAAGLEVDHGGWRRVVGSDLALTIPGTNTLELALLRVPSLVVVPFSLTPEIPAEGILDLLLRLPIVGPSVRLALARRYVKRLPYLALPNMRAGRQIMPELVGALTPEQVAAESAQLIRDEGARAAMARGLEAIPREPGASRRILDAMALMDSAA